MSLKSLTCLNPETERSSTRSILCWDCQSRTWRRWLRVPSICRSNTFRRWYTISYVPLSTCTLPTSFIEILSLPTFLSMKIALFKFVILDFRDRLKESKTHLWLWPANRRRKKNQTRMKSPSLMSRCSRQQSLRKTRMRKWRPMIPQMQLVQKRVWW